MQRFVAILLTFCLGSSLLANTARAKNPPAAKPQSAELTRKALGDFVVGDPVHYQNLIVFPVTTKTPRNEDRYLTLDEGLKAGTVQVFEVGAEPRAAAQSATAQPAAGQQAARQQPARQRAVNNARPPRHVQQQANPPANDDPFGGESGQQGAVQQEGADVNHLMFVNLSHKPLYLMPGEIIYGGQQDRTLAVEAIIPPDKKPVKVEVYCVEHGRWAGRDVAETNMALEVLADDSAVDTQTKAQHAETVKKLAAEAQKGKFVAHAGSLSKAGRAAVQEGKGQGAVWDEVGKANGSTGAQSQSNAFTANYTDPKMQKKLQAYIEAAAKPVADRAQVVGAIVAVNGKIQTVDVFQTTPLFRKIWPKLLKGHALDALASSSRPEPKKPCDVRDAEKFLVSAMQAGVEKKTAGQGGLVVTKRDSETVESFSAGMGGMGGASAAPAKDANFGDSVHSAGYGKK